MLKISKKTTWVIVNILALLIGAVFLTWLLEYRNRIDDGFSALDFLRSDVAHYTILLMLLMELVLYAIIWKPFTTIGAASSLILIIGYVHITKMSYRGSPLLPEDFKLAGEAGALVSFIDLWAIIRLIIAIVLVMKLAFMAEKYARKWVGISAEKNVREKAWWRRNYIVQRISIIVVAIVCFNGATGFIRNRSGVKNEYVPFLNTSFVSWNQWDNYVQNGFLVGFLYNAYDLTLSEPEGYSEEAIAEITAELEEKVDAKRKDLKDSDYNIVIVLNESFYDPKIIEDLYPHSGGEITPNWRKVLETYPSGYMYSVDFGGGTANVEWEVDTGLTNFWTNTVPFTSLAPQKEVIPSIATFAKNKGYQTLVLHPYGGSFYKRNLALPVLGYEDFVSLDEFYYTDPTEGSKNPYVSDQSSYNEVMKYLSEREEKQMIHLVTMQNHLPYWPEAYGESKFVLTGEYSESDRNSIESYMMTVNKSDEYLGEFLEKLDEFDEKTVVLFYGDHSPSVYGEARAAEDETMRNNSSLTPYFVYANFELPGQKKVLADSLRLPTTTPNCLTNTMLNLLNTSKPLVSYLLDDVCAEKPILTSFYFDEQPELTDTLKKYQLMTYDMAVGQQYSLEKTLN